LRKDQQLAINKVQAAQENLGRQMDLIMKQLEKLTEK